MPMRGLPNDEASPRGHHVRGGDKVTILPLERDDKIPLLVFIERILGEERYYL